MENFDFSIIDEAVNELGAKESSLITILQRVQEKYKYLPKEIFPYLEAKLGVSQARIYGVATFYENFSLERKGKYVIKVCDGTACHVKHSIPILEKLRYDLKLTETKKTTDDYLFTVETVSCLGACSSAPAMMLNDEIIPMMTPEKAMDIVKSLMEAENENA